MMPLPLLCLVCLAVASAAFVVSLHVPPAMATDQSRAPKTKPKGVNTPEMIKKCDNEETACNAGCDKNIIDIDNQVELCKRGCERERVLCLPFRRAPSIDPATGVNPASPPPAVRN